MSLGLVVVVGSIVVVVVGSIVVVVVGSMVVGVPSPRSCSCGS